MKSSVAKKPAVIITMSNVRSSFLPSIIPPATPSFVSWFTRTAPTDSWETSMLGTQVMEEFRPVAGLAERVVP